MPTYVWENKKTGEHLEVTCAVSDYDNLPAGIPESERDDWHRLLFPPAVLKRLIPSGFGIRQADGKWTNAKEIAKLEDDRMELRPGSKEREAISKEINTIKKVTK